MLGCYYYEHSEIMSEIVPVGLENFITFALNEVLSWLIIFSES